MGIAPRLRADLLSELRGQTLEIRGLGKAFASWQFAINPHVEEVRERVQTTLSQLFPNHPKFRKLLQGDYGLFGATWWPRASPERLWVATWLAIWLFLWDDEIDSDAGELAENFDQAQAFRADTLDFVRRSLQLEDNYLRPYSNNCVIQSFELIGDALCRDASESQRAVLLQEISFFLDKSEREQRFRLTGKMISLTDFWQFRLGTSAVRVVLAVNEYCNQTELPSRILEDEDLDYLVTLTNSNICNVNDLLSVRKEISQGSAESLIPIIYNEIRSLPESAEVVLISIRNTIKEFDIAAAKLFDRYRDEPELSEELVQYIDGCRFYCTGNLSWSLSTGRYGVFQDLSSDVLTIQL